MSGLGLVTPDDYSLTSDANIFEVAQQTKALGAKYVAEKKYLDAVSRYSEVIMQIRPLDKESPVIKNSDGKYTVEKDVRPLVQTCYLNLSMCFLKLGIPETDGSNSNSNFDESYLIHALNSAERALIGDLDPPDPEHSKVLTNDQKVKALFRKCSAGVKILEIEMMRDKGEVERRVEEEGQEGYVKLAKHGKISVESVEKDVKNGLGVLEKMKTDSSQESGNTNNITTQINDFNKIRHRLADIKKYNTKTEKERMGGLFQSNKTSSSQPQSLLTDEKSLAAREESEKKRKDEKEKELQKTVEKLQAAQIHKTLEEANKEGKPVNIDSSVTNDKDKDRDEEFFDNITSQLHEMKESNPEDFERLKEIMKEKCLNNNALPEEVLSGKKGGS